MSSTSLPTVILVHGAWHTPANYQPFTSALEARGFVMHCPALPSCNGARPPNAGLAEDAACIQDLVTGLADAGKSIFMVMHSYGGVVGSDTLKDLGTAQRQQVGKRGGIVHLLYHCAYMLPVGGSVWSIIEQAGYVDLYHQHQDVAEDGTVFPLDPRLLLFNDVDAAQTEVGLALLRRFPTAAFEARVGYEAWRELPSTYVYTTEDRCVPPKYQQIMTDGVKTAGVNFREERFMCGHSPFLSRTEETVEAVVRACGGK